jgi:hypothetical protein
MLSAAEGPWQPPAFCLPLPGAEGAFASVHRLPADKAPVLRKRHISSAPKLLREKTLKLVQ